MKKKKDALEEFIEEFIYKNKDRLITCKRCGYSWLIKNKKRLPKNCANPKCNSPYYNRERHE